MKFRSELTFYDCFNFYELFHINFPEYYYKRYLITNVSGKFMQKIGRNGAKISPLPVI